MKDHLLEYIEIETNRWHKSYIKCWGEKIKISNDRLFRAVLSTRDAEFVSQIKSFVIATKSNGNLLSITRAPKGNYFNDRRFELIPGFFLEQRHTAGNEIKGTIFVQIDDKRFLEVPFWVP